MVRFAFHDWFRFCQPKMGRALNFIKILCNFLLSGNDIKDEIPLCRRTTLTPLILFGKF